MMYCQPARSEATVILERPAFTVRKPQFFFIASITRASFDRPREAFPTTPVPTCTSARVRPSLSLRARLPFMAVSMSLFARLAREIAVSSQIVVYATFAAARMRSPYYSGETSFPPEASAIYRSLCCTAVRTRRPFVRTYA